VTTPVTPLWYKKQGAGVRVQGTGTKDKMQKQQSVGSRKNQREVGNHAS